MVIRNYHWMNSASRVLNLTCSAPLVQTGKRKQTLFDLDLWPTTLTYNPRLANVKVDPHAKNQGQRSNGSNRRAPTDKRMDTHTHTRTLPNLLSIITDLLPAYKLATSQRSYGKTVLVEFGLNAVLFWTRALSLILPLLVYNTKWCHLTHDGNLFFFLIRRTVCILLSSQPMVLYTVYKLAETLRLLCSTCRMNCTKCCTPTYGVDL